MGGLLVLAVNPNISATDQTHLLTEHEISWDRYDRSFRNSERRTGKSAFGYRMASSAALLLAHQDGLLGVEQDDPEVLLNALHRTSRLQAVKCVPVRSGSRPTTIMARRCPMFLLEDELCVLRPGVILALGSVPDAAIAELPGYEYLEPESSEFLWRHRVQATWGQVEVYAMPHPADRRGGWKRGHDELRNQLSLGD